MQIEQLLCCVHETASLLLDDVARAEILGMLVRKYRLTDEQSMVLSDLAAIALNAAGEISAGSTSRDMASAKIAKTFGLELPLAGTVLEICFGRAFYPDSTAMLLRLGVDPLLFAKVFDACVNALQMADTGASEAEIRDCLVRKKSVSPHDLGEIVYDVSRLRALRAELQHGADLRTVAERLQLTGPLHMLLIARLVETGELLIPD